MEADAASAAAGRHQVIELWLMRARDMFELPQPDLFSEYRNFLTGVDFCLSELRGRASSRPVRLQIYLPAAEIDDGMAGLLAINLRRYCANRIRYNRRESRAQRFEGVSALRVGVPICAVGLALTISSSAIKPTSGIAHILSDQLGWVLIWIGLWFPLDQMLFYPLAYGRESRALRLLGNADVTVSAHPAGGPPDATGAAHLGSHRDELERDPWRRSRRGR